MTSFWIPVACMGLLCALLAAIVQPVLARRHAWRRATGVRRQRLELTERKEQLYASIRELEFDHSLGKLSQQDYDAVRVGLEADAVAVLRDLDGLQASTHDTERIEADIAARRDTPATAAEPAAPVKPATTAEPAGSHAFCHQCGKPRTPQYRFCPHCGQSFATA